MMSLWEHGWLMLKGFWILGPITCESIGDVNSYLLWFQCSCWLWRLRWWCHHQEFCRRKIYIAKNNVDMFGICVISFDQDEEKKFMQHCKLDWSGSRCKETFKLETLFWYVAALFEIHGQWHKYWKPLVTRKVWSQCLVGDWKKTLQIARRCQYLSDLWRNWCCFSKTNTNWLCSRLS